MNEELVENKIENINEEEATVETLERPDNVFRIEEMIDSIEVSIFNIHETVKEQSHLITVLEQLEKPEFDKLITTMKEQLDYMTTQSKTLSERQEYLIHVVNQCKSSDEIKEVVNILLDGLGIFKN